VTIRIKPGKYPLHKEPVVRQVEQAGALLPLLETQIFVALLKIDSIEAYLCH